MLVLTRKVDQDIYIMDGDIIIAVVRVLGTEGQRVKLGIEAEQGLTILRAELRDRVVK